jgi:MerR HTH family regulatory protein
MKRRLSHWVFGFSSVPVGQLAIRSCVGPLKTPNCGNDLLLVGKAEKAMVAFRGPGEGHSRDRGKWSFGQLLDWHLLRGTRRGGQIDQAGRKWSTKELADAIGVQPRTIRYWKKNEHLPTEIETLERVLFGADACYAEWRLELRHAHAITQGVEIGAVTSASFEPNRDLWAGNTLPAFNIPIRVPFHFMGRDDALAAIETALARRQGRVAITTLHGLRGVGKTTLAAAYAERHRSDYRAIWWIRAQTEPTMRADLVALGVRLGWVGREDKEEPAFTAVMDGLRNDGEGILLIFDNAIDADKLKSYLPSGGAARVVVTSNTHAWRRLAEPVEIRLWPKNIGADYLVARTGREGERQAAEALSEDCRSRTNRLQPIVSDSKSPWPSTSNASMPPRRDCSMITAMRPSSTMTG